MADPQKPLEKSESELVKILLLHILALHTKRLTRRNLLGLLDLLEGTLGFNPGGFRALASLGEFGLSSRNIALQGLTLLHSILELLLDLVRSAWP